MGTTQDGMMSLLGPGQLNDLLLGYYQDNGASSSNITDAEYEFLLSRGASAENVQDMWDWYLRDLGYSGSLSDMLLDFWSISIEGLTLYTRPLVDDVGKSSRTVFKPQSGLFAIGDYLTGDIASGTTVVSEEGTGSISLSEDQLDYTDDEFLWSFELSNGSTYEHPTIVGTDAIWFDTSGNGRHLTGSVADINAHHHVDDTLRFGSDHENQGGLTLSDGASYYLNDDDTGLIPIDVPIPALADGSGCAAYLAGGSMAPLTYQGRAKYDIELVNNPTTLFDGVGDFIELENIPAMGDIWKISFIAALDSDNASYADIISNGNSFTPGDITLERQATQNQMDLILYPEGTSRQNTTGVFSGSFDGVIHKYTILYDNGSVTFKIDDEVTDTRSVTHGDGFPAQRNFMVGDSSAGLKGSTLSVDINNTHFPLEESEGTTVYGYDLVDPEAAAVTGTVTASDIAAFWSGEKDGPNHNYLYGSSDRENLLTYSSNFDPLHPNHSRGGNVASTPNDDVSATKIELTGTIAHQIDYDISEGVSTGDSFTITTRIKFLQFTGDFELALMDGSATSVITPITPVVDNEYHIIQATLVAVADISAGSFIVRICGYAKGIDGDTFWVDYSQCERGEPKGYIETTANPITGTQPANPNTGLSVLGQPLTVPPRRLTDQTWVNQECIELMDAELNMDLDGGGDNSAHTEEVLYDESGNAKELTLTDSGVELLGSELVVNGDFSDGTTGWSETNGATIENIAGNLIITAGATAEAYSYNATNVPLGGTFLVDADFLGTTGNARNEIVIWNSDWTALVSATAELPIIIEPTGSSIKLGLVNYGDSGDTATYDNISVREVLTEEDHNFNNQILIGPKGEAVYGERQTDSNATKALKIVGVS